MVMSVVDMDRIFEISVNKIEHSKSRKVYGKSTMLHRTLLVNTVMNRVRNSDHRVHNINNNKNESSFTNYREPKRIYDMDDHESDKSLTYMECQTRCKAKHNTTTPQKKKNSSLVSLLNSRAMNGKTDESTRIIRKTDECELEKENQESVQINTRHEKRRFVSTSSEVADETQPCPTKKLRCIWPANVSDVNSITGLASLFGDLVASSDAEKSSMSLNSNFATAMVAC